MGWGEPNIIKNEISDEKISLFNEYAKEFEEKYLLEPQGQKHLEVFMKEREEVPKYWEKIKKLKQENKPITDEVLTKLLPYNDTRHNRESARAGLSRN